MRRRRSAWLLLRDAGVNALIVAQITIVHGYSSRVVRNTFGGPEADGGAFREGFPFLDSLLEKLHLQDLDGADLMLLLLLFFLFEEKADDELLIALGLLLIL